MLIFSQVLVKIGAINMYANNAETFSVTGNTSNKNYVYPQNAPLVDNNGNFPRAYYSDELLQIIEITESAARPGTTNALDIPVFFGFAGSVHHAEPPDIQISENTQKYYCCFRANKDLTDRYPNTPKALTNISILHTHQLLTTLKKANHRLPLTVVHQIAMNDNHVGIVVLRIKNLNNPADNEVMVINSLPGYDDWENAAVNGIIAAMQAASNTRNVPERINLTPHEYLEIKQEELGLKSSCSGIVAAMSCAISHKESLSVQKDRLIAQMLKVTGKDNEVKLRKHHQDILQQPHPSKPGFDQKKVRPLLLNGEPYQSIMYQSPATNAQKRPKPSGNVQHSSKVAGKQAAPSIPTNNLNIPLPFTPSHLKPGKAIKPANVTNFSIFKENSPLKPINPNLTNAYTYGNANRPHDFDLTANDNFKNINKVYKTLKGDGLKNAILTDFLNEINSTTSITELNTLKNRLMQTPEYKILATAQDITTYLFSAFINTSSVNAFNAMFEQQEDYLNSQPRQKY